MPYVAEEARAKYAKLLEDFRRVIDVPGITPGELNYLISCLSYEYVVRKGKNYTHLNDVMGVFDSASKEFYRRVVVPYEDRKITENGDVFMHKILKFDGEYDFLSNFYSSPVTVWHATFPTAEHAYQRAKFFDGAIAEAIRCAPTPGVAKKLGRSKGIRDDWEDVKISIMTEVVRAKFNQSSRLTQKLLATGDAILEEGNHWNDTFWGVCPVGSGNGRNKLGDILMKIRDELRG